MKYPKDIEWYHFWDPRSGPIGGIIFVCVLWAIYLVIKYW